jgi:DNA-binding transcriptional MerR regulator
MDGSGSSEPGSPGDALAEDAHPADSKAAGAFRTIREVSDQLGVPQHVLRFWETRFAQLKPLQRGGNRRYYRPADVALAARLHQLLHRDGYTVKGVQKLLASKTPPAGGAIATPPATAGQQVPVPGALAALRAIRNRLATALAA